MDETFKQLIREARELLAACPGAVERLDTARAKVNWHVTIDQARNKLRSLYPSFQK